MEQHGASNQLGSYGRTNNGKIWTSPSAMDKSKEAANHRRDRKGSSVSMKERTEKVPLEDPVLLHRLSLRPAPPRQADKPGLFGMKGLLTAHRFSRGLKERIALKKAASKALTRKPVVIVNEQQVPPGSAQPTELFPRGVVSQVLQGVLSSRVEAVASACCGDVMKVLSEEVRALVRTVCPPRYRLVCIVTLVWFGPDGRQGNGLILASRCLWDPHADILVSHTHQTHQMCCTANVFGVYCE
ncbi:hypothetical protein DPEC_G00273500 [Dallia pectoralis]|uniref:Uncharacterized protein n=1 Tax=Dallia pectoralis TaxID=75939 RepID=A0ACC2FQE8_DALPE|nr:hypothetical protein DPEC_G00273500 [Dallia pectoralis]